MIVCVCNRHNDREIRAKAAEIGSTCPVTVYTALEGPPRCGRCLEFAGSMLRSEGGGRPQLCASAATAPCAHRDRAHRDNSGLALRAAGGGGDAFVA